MRVLAGDIGGTKVLLQLAEIERSGYRPIAEQRFESAAYDGLLPIVREFLQSPAAATAPAAACFGIAGPILSTPNGQVARVTNLPWSVEAAQLAQALTIPQVRLINDFQAVGYGIEALTPDDLMVLHPGERRPQAPCAVIGAGTGLGQGLLVWHGDHYESLPTEGGHVDFAPTDEVQVELLCFLRERYGRVSYERVLSGPGLANLYAFFRARNRATGNDLLRADDPPAAIATAALHSNDATAAAALQLFVKIYGAQAGNVALSCLAAGGVYLAGGIGPKILPAFADGSFNRSFTDKGRMSALLVSLPVYLIMNQRVGLIGAALAASRLS
ncbi:MAG: glucokinase [Gammaproteobacteria bacterium]|nr:glucokinase [Gammaproteobacteria bacterium]